MLALERRPELAERARAALILFAGNGGLRRLPERSSAADVAATLFERDARDVAAILRHTRALRDAGWTVRRADLNDDAHAFVRGCLAFLAQDFGTAATAFSAAANDRPTANDGAVAADLLRFLTTTGLTDPAISASLRRPTGPLAGTGRVLVVVQPSVEVPSSSTLPVGRPCIVLGTQPIRGEIGGAREATVTVDEAFQTSERGRSLRSSFDRMATTLAENLAARQGLRDSAGTIADVLRARCLTTWFLARETERLIAATRPERVMVVAAQASFVTAIRQACGRTACDVVWVARPRLDDDLFCHWPSPQTVSLRRGLASGQWPRVGALPRARIPQGASIVAGEIRSAADEDRLAVLASTMPTGVDLLLVLSGAGERGAAIARRCEMADRRTRFVDADAPGRGHGEADLDLVRRVQEAAAAAAARIKLPAKLRASGRSFIGSVMAPTLASAPEFEQAASLLRLVDRAGGAISVMTRPNARVAWLEILSERARRLVPAPEVTGERRGGKSSRPAGIRPSDRVRAIVRMLGRAKTAERAGDVLVARAVRQGLTRSVLQSLPARILPALFEAASENFSLLQRLVASSSGLRTRMRRLASLGGEEFGFVRAMLAFARHDHRTARREFVAWAASRPDTTSGAAAAEACRFIDAWGLERPAIVSSMRTSTVVAGKGEGEHWLVVIEPSAARALSVSLPPDRRMTVLAASSEVPPSLGGRLEAVHVVDAEFAASDRGRHLRSKFEAVAKRFAETLASSSPRLGTEHLTADVLRARTLTAWNYLNEVACLTREVRFDRVLVFTAWPAFFLAIDAVARCRSGHAEAVWTAHPRVEPGQIPFWPSPSDLAARRRARVGALVLGPKRLASRTKEKQVVLAGHVVGEPDIARFVESLERLSPEVGAIALIDGPGATLACARRLIAVRPDRIGVVRAGDFVGKRIDRETLVVAVRAATDAAKGRRGRLFGFEGRMRAALVDRIFVPTLTTAPEFERSADLLDWLVALNLPVVVVGPKTGTLPPWLRVVVRGESSTAIDCFSSRSPETAVPMAVDGEPPARIEGVGESRTGLDALIAAEARPRSFGETLAERMAAEGRPVTRTGTARSEPPRGRAKPVAERVAICLEAIARGRNVEHAERILLGLARRRVVKPIDLPETLYPRLFDEVAFQIAPARRLCDDLARWRPRSAEARNAPTFAFVRGLLAFYRQDFPTAKREFETHVASFPTAETATAAHGFLNFLSIYPLHDSEYLEHRRSPGSLAMRQFSKKSVLILSEGTLDEIESTFEGVPPDCRVTVLLRYMYDLTRKPKPGWNFVFMPRNMWYLPEGKALHKRLEALCEEAATAIGRTVPSLATCPFGIKAHLVDSALLEFWMYEKLGELLKERRFDTVVVLTRRLSFYKTVREIVRNHSWTTGIRLHIPSGPNVGKAPSFVYWPRQELLKARFFTHLLKRKLPKRAKRAPPVPKPEAATPPVPVVPAVPALPTLPVTIAAPAAPALLAWSIGDKNYDLSLKRVAAAALRFRALVVVTLGGREDDVVEMRKKLEEMAAEAGRDLLFVHYNSFLREGRDRHVVIRDATRAAAALAPPRRRLHRDEAPEDDPFRRNDLPYGFVDSFNIGALDATMQWLDALCRARKPAYAVTCPGRVAFLAAIAEHLQGHNIPCADLHLYFVGDAARQMPTPHHYYATLDTMVARFVTNYWGIPAENVVRVGYMWGNLTEGYDTVQPFERHEGEFLVVYASQPIQVDIAAPFAESILEVVAEFPNVRLLVKPHPNDEKASLEWIERRIGEMNLGDRVEMMPLKSPIGPMLDAADLVITRTSNVALEAAFRYKSVVRGIMYDLSLPPTSLDVPYAINARDHESFEDALKAMISDPQMRARQREAQQRYIEENPSLVDIKGNIRFVDFMEEQVRRARPK